MGTLQKIEELEEYFREVLEVGWEKRKGRIGRARGG